MSKTCNINLLLLLFSFSATFEVVSAWVTSWSRLLSAKLLLSEDNVSESFVNVYFCAISWTRLLSKKLLICEDNLSESFVNVYCYIMYSVVFGDAHLVFHTQKQNMIL